MAPRRPTTHSSCCSPGRRQRGGARPAAMEVAHHIAACAPDLLVETSCGLLDQSFFQWASGKLEKARTSGPASSSREATSGNIVELRGHPVELGVYLIGGGLLVDGAVHGGHPGLGAPGDPSEQVGHDAAPLPAGSAEDCQAAESGVAAPPRRGPWRTCHRDPPSPRHSPLVHLTLTILPSSLTFRVSASNHR